MRRRLLHVFVVLAFLAVIPAAGAVPASIWQPASVVVARHDGKVRLRSTSVVSSSLQQRAVAEKGPARARARRVRQFRSRRILSLEGMGLLVRVSSPSTKRVTHPKPTGTTATPPNVPTSPT